MSTKSRWEAGRKSGAVCPSRHRSSSRVSRLQRGPQRPDLEGPSRQGSETTRRHHENGHPLLRCRFDSRRAAGRRHCARGTDDQANTGGHEPVDWRRSEAAGSAASEAQSAASWQRRTGSGPARCTCCAAQAWNASRSEEHTSELQSQSNLVCRLLLEKKKKTKDIESSDTQK